MRDGLVDSEHVYWDQATVLAQVALLDVTGLPVIPADQARPLAAKPDTAVFNACSRRYRRQASGGGGARIPVGAGVPLRGHRRRTLPEVPEVGYVTGYTPTAASQALAERVTAAGYRLTSDPEEVRRPSPARWVDYFRHGTSKATFDYCATARVG